MRARRDHSGSLVGSSRIVFGFLLLFLFASRGFADSKVVTEENIRKAILGGATFTEKELRELDLNWDGHVDAADLVQYYHNTLDSFPSTLVGYVWAGAAIHDSQTGNAVAANYPFALSIREEPVGTIKATSTTIPGFNPTAGILRQDLAESGQVPGSTRPAFSVSLAIPNKHEFDYTEDDETATLTSLVPITIPPDDARNPTGLELRRSWRIVIDKAALFGGGTNHGTITEETNGFLPGVPLRSTGKLYLSPYSQADMAPIE